MAKAACSSIDCAIEDISSVGSGETTLDLASSNATNTIHASSIRDNRSRPSSDASHLHWKTFRKNVLAPHRIRVLEGPPGYPLPRSLIALIHAAGNDVGKFEMQRQKFREQVTAGRGFGLSPSFPSNLLPAIDNEPALSRCAFLKFNEEALPKRHKEHGDPLCELFKPQSDLGCGFSHDAFAGLEVSKIPLYLVAHGTIARCSVGKTRPGTSLFCPFLIFERTFGPGETRLEAANNQCAIAGALSNSSMQMLFAQVWSSSEEPFPDPPVSFSCTIDNDVAIINYHWIDSLLGHCTSPICKFELGDDEHFHHFNVWIQAIEQWGIKTLLPVIKRALSSLEERSRPQVETESPSGRPELRIDTVLEEDALMTSLRDSSASHSCSVEDDDFTPVSSSVAAWGSPIINEFFYNNLQFHSIPRRQHSSRTSSRSNNTRFTGDPASIVIARTPVPAASTQPRGFGVSTPLTPAAFTFSSTNSNEESISPPPSYTGLDTELVYQKRLSHAMDEIRDLQDQLQRLRREMSGLTTSYQNELSGLKNTIDKVLHRVESPPSTAGLVSPSSSVTASSTTTTIFNPHPITNTMNASLTMKDVYTDLQHARQLSQATVVTTPTDPRPKNLPWDRQKSQRARSSLQQVLTVDTEDNQAVPADTTHNAFENEEQNFKPIPVEVAAPTRSPLSARIPQSPPILGPMSAASPSPASVIGPGASSALEKPPASPETANTLRWTAILLGLQALGTFIPSTVLRIAFLGLVTDFALLALASPQWPSTAGHILEWLRK